MYEIHYVFYVDAVTVECDTIEDTMKELRDAIFGGEHYDEEGGKWLLDIEDWLTYAEPGDIYKERGGFYIRRK